MRTYEVGGHRFQFAEGDVPPGAVEVPDPSVKVKVPPAKRTKDSGPRKPAREQGK